MMNLKKRNSLILVSAFIIFLGACFLLLNYALPPFQNPDEPMHFSAIMINLKGEERQAEIEKQIIAFMDKYNWWRLVGLGRPAHLPSKLIEISFLTQNYPIQDLRVLLNNLVFYHKSMAAWLKLIGSRDLSPTKAYYLLRFASVAFSFFSLLIIYCVWKKTGSLFFEEVAKDEWSKNKLLDFNYLLMPIFMTALLPQFLIISLAVSPDAFCLLLGSIFFASAFNLVQGSRPALNTLLIIFIALIGFFTDRSLFFLLILVLLCLVLILNVKNLRKSIMVVIGSVFLLLMSLYIVVHVSPRLIENGFSLAATPLRGGLAALKRLFSLDSFSRQFLVQLADSFLICFGWMTFKASTPVYFIWRLFILAAAVGLVVLSVRLMKAMSKNSALIKIIFFSLAAVVLQIVAIYAYYGRVGSLPQGRYLFPLIIPIIFLLVLGITNLFSLFSRRAAFASLALVLILEFILFNYVLWGNIIPTFHLTIKSPYPGI